jgi:hypothetical protein
VTRRVRVEVKVVARGAVRGVVPSGVGSSELGTSSSIAVHGTVGPARSGVPMGGTIGVSFESKKKI